MRYLSALLDWMTCLNVRNGNILLVSECENCLGRSSFSSVSLVCVTDDVVGFWKLSKVTFLYFLVTWNCTTGSSITSQNFHEALCCLFCEERLSLEDTM